MRSSTIKRRHSLFLRRRRGVIAIFAALIITAMVFLIAFAVDIGFVCTIREELQRAADAGALAGAGELINGKQAAIDSASKLVTANKVGNRALSSSEMTIHLGQWDRNSRTFTNGASPYDTVQVLTKRDGTSFFFAKAMGYSAFNTNASAIATAQPRDIVLVLDFSGSMNDENKVDALKDAVDLFVNYLQSAKSADRVGFVRYSTTATKVLGLTTNLSSVNSAVQATSATGYTNIGDGLNLARLELEKNKRPLAKTLIVLMTDGIANRPSDRDPLQYILDEASLCAGQKFPIVAISFGSDADQTIMKKTADISPGIHFHVAGTVDQQSAALKKVFIDVAANVPLMLVD